MDFVNGYFDHCHCLFKLPSKWSVADVAKQLKGESSHWINEELLTENRFEWQDEYYAESIHESQVGRVREYIRKQEEHHKDENFEKEMERFGFSSSG